MHFSTFRNLFYCSMAVILLALSSCATPYNVAYFQDMPIEQQVKIVPPQHVVFRPGDRISIMVSARDASLSSLFSLYSTYIIGEATGNSNMQQSQRGSEYVINADGCIDFPVLGRIKAAGMSREELQESIKQEIITQNLIKDPVITIDYINLNVIMIGATGVGRIPIDRDQFSILDAIAQAGDISLNGMRENIRVIREVSDDQRIAYEVNLCSAEDLYNSPVFYLQQNDVIYVEPNNKTKRSTTEYGSQMVQYTFWIGLVTSALSMIAIFK